MAFAQAVYILFVAWSMLLPYLLPDGWVLTKCCLVVFVDVWP